MNRSMIDVASDFPDMSVKILLLQINLSHEVVKCHFLEQANLTTRGLFVLS